DQHTTERGRENLLRLRTERDTNAQLAKPLAAGIRGEAEGAGDREQESKSAKDAESDGSYLDWKETQCKLSVPGARFLNSNSSIKIAEHFANADYHIGRVALGPDDERGPCVPLLRDWEEHCGFRIFTERKV